MKRSRDGHTVATPTDSRERVLKALKPLISNVVYLSIQHQDTHALMSLLAQIQTPREE